MDAETARVRVTFTAEGEQVTSRRVRIFIDAGGSWSPLRTIDLPFQMTVDWMPRFVDAALREEGWRRVSDLHTWPATEPREPFDEPNRAGECTVRRGLRERISMMQRRSELRFLRGQEEWRRRHGLS